MQDSNTLQRAKFYAPELDGLRFVAALLVFIHHAPEVWPLGFVKSYGWVGVDLFLTISAFLITRLILIEHENNGSFDLRAFFIRRALRIWPLFFSYVSLISLYAVTVGAADGQVVFGWWLSHISFTNNILTAIHGYSPIPFSAHLWTISLEEQAYIAIPLLLMIFLTSGKDKKAAIFVCSLLILILLLSRTALVALNTPHPFIWVSPLRADAFIFGALGAILYNAPPQESERCTCFGRRSVFVFASLPKHRHSRPRTDFRLHSSRSGLSICRYGRPSQGRCQGCSWQSRAEVPRKDFIWDICFSPRGD